ncbi:MAG TPA: DUF5723 family protein [Melioribacteraceae bacterium]|nr:DUF5723 family protein [Melioribacteraceae bacterium]
MKNLYKIYAVLFLLLGSSVFGQGGAYGILDPVSAGMGNTYTAGSRGIYAIGHNPANLAFNNNNDAVEFNTVLPLPSMTLLVGTDFISISEYNYFFGGVEQNGKTVARHLTDDDKTRLKKLFADGGTLLADFSIDYLSFAIYLKPQIGTIAFKMSDNSGFYAHLPAQLSDFALEGNPLGSYYNFSDASIDFQYLRTYSLSYARQIPEIPQTIFKKVSAGISLNFISGFSMIKSERIRTTFETKVNGEIEAVGDNLIYTAFSPDFGVEYDFDSIDVESNIGAFPKPAGSGFGLDFGFAAQLDDVLSFGLSVTGIGSVTWDKNVAEYSSNKAMIVTDITDESVRDSLADLLTANGKSAESYKTDLPTALHLGVTYQLDKAPFIKSFPGTLLIALDYNQGFNDVARNSKVARWSLGFEWRPWKIFPIRTGFSFGGKDKKPAWSFGTGIDTNTFEFSFAAYNFGNLMQANDATKISLAFGTRWRI